MNSVIIIDSSSLIISSSTSTLAGPDSNIVAHRGLGATESQSLHMSTYGSESAN